MELKTDRLLLRHWRDGDRDGLADLNADPRVMEFFPSVATRVESDAQFERLARRLDEDGYGMWAVELLGDGSFAGFIGLGTPRFEAHFTPCIEIGWRLRPDVWNQGLATEGARAVLAFGFEELQLAEIVAFTAAINVRSRRVMEKLAMTHDEADDFDHPLIAADHPLRPHVLYRRRRGIRGEGRRRG